MKSGLEGRNNSAIRAAPTLRSAARLNEVRPRRPEQCATPQTSSVAAAGLNEVRPRRPEQCAVARRVKLSSLCLNEVRPRRPAQLFEEYGHVASAAFVSMKSGLEGRNNRRAPEPDSRASSLNEVRPRRPEQSKSSWVNYTPEKLSQ